jgi:DNA-binding transcriptional MerR regulator
MVRWQIKEMSDLTQTSKRMLRHYDKIGLLKPSYRASNGYRWYTEQDLAKLQQIIALKYFGFSLVSIKTMLSKHSNIQAHLQAQQLVVQQESLRLQQVSDALTVTLNRLPPHGVPNWNDLIILIERYRMTENLRKTLKESWAGQELSAAQFEEYLAIYEQFPKEFAERDQLIDQINQKKVGAPDSPDGERIVSFMIDLMKKTKKQFTQQLKFGSGLVQSIQSGKLSQLQLTQEGLQWMSQATLAFWLKRWDSLYEQILGNLTLDPRGAVGQKIAKEWKDLLDTYFSSRSREFLTGLILWQELARQDAELKKMKEFPTPQEIIKGIFPKIYFNPDAMAWMSHALESHPDK